MVDRRLKRVRSMLYVLLGHLKTLCPMRLKVLTPLTVTVIGHRNWSRLTRYGHLKKLEIEVRSIRVMRCIVIPNRLFIQSGLGPRYGYMVIICRLSFSGFFATKR